MNNIKEDTIKDGVHKIIEFRSSKDLLELWAINSLRSTKAHYMAANKFSKLNIYLGIPAIIFATIVGTSVFATLEKDVSANWRIAVGLISVCAALFSALQTFSYNLANVLLNTGMWQVAMVLFAVALKRYWPLKIH